MKINKQSAIHGIPVYITIIICCILILPGCAAPAPSTTQPPPPPSPPSAPASFKVTSLNVTPIVAEPGQAVTIEVKVMNEGGTAGSSRQALTVNGVEEQIKDVMVVPRATKSVTFILTKDISGIYEIKVDGLTETLRVKRPGDFPRLGNYYNGINAFFYRLQQFTPSQLNSIVNTLARWDLIVINYDVSRYTPESIRQIRKQNPQAKILAYIEAGSGGMWRWLLTDDLEVAQDKPSWLNPYYMRQQAEYYGITVQDSNESFFLHYGDTPGNPKPPEQRRWILWTLVTTGEQGPGMNPHSEWSSYLPNFVHDKVMSTGLFDGVFYDCFVETMWESNLDIDNDGVGDSLNVVNQKYKEGMERLLQLTRELLGPEAIIIGNPGDEWSANSLYWEYANGHMQECALGGEAWSSQWPKVWDIYRRNMQKPEPPSRIHWIAVDTKNVQYDPFNPKLPPTDLQRMRFGLAITLLDDGYFGFDIGIDFHGELWWFPEYDANLGFALGDAQKRSDGSWMREFENGVVVANPTSKDSIIEFAATYKDVTTGNNGTRFVVQPQDGRIFVLTH